MKFLCLIVFVLAGVVPACHGQAQLVGEWRGTISFNGQDFRIAWHVVKADDGRITSTFDNIDQNLYGIKAKSTTLHEDDLVIAVDDTMEIDGQETRIAGEYRGKVSKDFSEVKGNFTQTQPEEQPTTELNFKREPAAPKDHSPAIVAFGVDGLG